MSPETSLSDMRKKLLEIQNELLKGAGEKNSPNTETSLHDMGTSTQHTTAPVNKSAGFQSNDVVLMLKEVLSNQKKILDILGEINGKLR